jgi:hypothetical protein
MRGLNPEGQTSKTFPTFHSDRSSTDPSPNPTIALQSFPISIKVSTARHHAFSHVTRQMPSFITLILNFPMKALLVMASLIEAKEKELPFFNWIFVPCRSSPTRGRKNSPLSNGLLVEA